MPVLTRQFVASPQPQQAPPQLSPEQERERFLRERLGPALSGRKRISDARSGGAAAPFGLSVEQVASAKAKLSNLGGSAAQSRNNQSGYLGAALKNEALGYAQDKGIEAISSLFSSSGPEIGGNIEDISNLRSSVSGIAGAPEVENISNLRDSVSGAGTGAGAAAGAASLLLGGVGSGRGGVPASSGKMIDGGSSKGGIFNKGEKILGNRLGPQRATSNELKSLSAAEAGPSGKLGSAAVNDVDINKSGLVGDMVITYVKAWLGGYV